MLGNHDLGPALVQVRDDIVAVERRIADQRPKGEPVDERRPAHRVEPLPRQKHKAHEIAERVGERHDLGGQAALGPADGLARSPPFAPCPWRWTLTMVASTKAYSRSGSSETASNSRWKTPAFTQCQRRLNFPHFCRSNIPQAAGSVISRWVDQALSAAADVPGAWARAVA